MVDFQAAYDFVRLVHEMKLGVRAKIFVLLTAVALLPLLTAMVINLWSWASLRGRTISESILGLAESEALVRQVSLTSDVQKLLLVMTEPSIQVTINQPHLLPKAQLDELDRRWLTMPLTDPPMHAVLVNPAAGMLKEVQRRDPRLRQLLITDRYGQLVAATGRTEDFFQADEDWWQKAYAGGKGHIFIANVEFNVENSHAWTVDVCVPVVSGDQVIGVAKAQIDASQWVEILGSAGGKPVKELPDRMALMLVNGDGTVVYRAGAAPLSQHLAPWPEMLHRRAAGGWRIVGDEIQAFSEIRLRPRIDNYPVTMPDWLAVVYAPRSLITQPVHVVSILIVAVSVVLIAMVFLLGLFLIDRSLVRRILSLQEAAQKVARGDLTQRVRLDRLGGRVLGSDEIDQLIIRFNQMVERMEQSTEELRSANELKSNFIRVAGHELRTPVSYILGMARLLKESNDATRLLFAVQSMGAKARRLNEIIQAMFKLMPGGVGGEGMRYSLVSLSELLENIYIDIFPFVESRNQRLVIEMVDRLPTIRADADKLRDIIENLAMNAIKFTPDGGVVQVRASLQLGDRVMISVQDQGPGIPENEYPRLFQPFYSGGDVLTHSTGEAGYQKRGIGLGLAIVRHFVELHHGTVHVSSSPMGTTFSVTIPVEPPPEQVVTGKGSPQRQDRPQD